MHHKIYILLKTTGELNRYKEKNNKTFILKIIKHLFWYL